MVVEKNESTFRAAKSLLPFVEPNEVYSLSATAAVVLVNASPMYRAEPGIEGCCPVKVTMETP